MGSSPPINSIAALTTLAILSAAIIASFSTQSMGLLSLIPPDATEPDALGRELSLGLSAFTAWATVVLLIPAYVAVWFRNRSARAWQLWLAFWAAGFVAYIVHLVISMFGFFGGDFAWMTSSTRVSAFWPGMALAIWWPIDLWLARRPETTPIAVQRVVLHIGAFVLFFGGSAVKGELGAIRLIGYVLLAATILALGKWILVRKAAV
jgi:hypothetical protein